MPIERLLYQEDGSNPLDLRYEGENEEECIKANTGMDQVFQHEEERVGGDCIITRNSISSFRMGWNTAAIFEKEESHLKVKHIYSIVNGGEKPDTEGNGIIAKIKEGEFHQITTQAIDTCTLICIETETDYLLAHFMLSRIEDFVGILGDKISQSTVKKVFFSGWMSKFNEYDNEAFDELKRRTGQAEFICFDRSIPPRDGNAQEKMYYLAHFEFGIGWDGDTMTYFGDIVHMSDQIPLENSRRCCTFACEQISDLSDMETWAGALK